MIILFTTLCIANVVIHYNEISDDPSKQDLSGGEIFLRVFKTYWISFAGTFVAVLFSIFVFALCGFHTMLIFRGLTTQEFLKHMYDNFPKSPFSYSGWFTNWKKVICCPRITHTRLYYMLYLKHRNEEKFDQLRQERGDTILPNEMVEQSIQIYEPPINS